MQRRFFGSLTPRGIINSHLSPEKRAFELTNWPVTPAQPVPNYIAKTPYFSKPDGRMPSFNRNPGHIHLIIKKNAKVVAAARLLAIRASIPGVSTDQIDRLVHEYLIQRNTCPAGINFWNFPKSVCASVNEIVCHGIPNTRPMLKGDVASFDVTCWSEGFFGDNAGCVLIGDDDSNPFPVLRRLVSSCKESVNYAASKCGPGVTLKVVQEAVGEVAAREGFILCSAFHGHFIGEEMHMHPLVPSIPVRNPSIDQFQLRPGHVFTIEPIFMEGGAKGDVFTMNDGWSSCSIDGKKGVQWEHMIAVNDDGVEILTQLSEEEIEKIPFAIADEFAHRCVAANKDLILEQQQRLDKLNEDLNLA